MAGLVTHVLLALKLFDLGLIDTDKEAFIVGTSLPDIRKIDVIERTQTHYNNMTWNDVLNEPSAFIAGMKFHSLVDEVRERFFTKMGIYKRYSTNTIGLSHCMKFVEDGFLYNKYKHWKSLLTLFDQIYDEERSFGIDEEGLEIWHQIIKVHCQQKPTIASLKNNIEAVTSYYNLPKKFMIKLMFYLSCKPLIKQLEHDLHFIVLTFEFYNNFETIMLEY